MSTGMRVIPMRSSPGAAEQNPENRSTDPTPLKDPSGYVNNVPKVKANNGWMPVITHSLASGAFYTGINYGIHKAMKTSKKDPAAIKELSAGKIIKQGGMQVLASAASGMTYQAVGQYVPGSITKYAPVKPLLTGVYKVAGGALVSGVPTLWNGVKDLMISSGSDYASDWVYPAY